MIFPTSSQGFCLAKKGKKKNFREESVTDMLMAGLIPLQYLGIIVDWPDEPLTGGDKIFASPKDFNGGRYFRMILQAKRAKRSSNRQTGYLYCDQLDHGNPKGRQAETLVDYAKTLPDGMPACPLYIFYHPEGATRPRAGKKPAFEGINLMFAHDIVSIVQGGCGRASKRVELWRYGFMPLSTVLCWPIFNAANQPTPDEEAASFIVDSSDSLAAAGFHPDIVAERLRAARRISLSKRPHEVSGGRANYWSIGSYS